MWEIEVNAENGKDYWIVGGEGPDGTPWVALPRLRVAAVMMTSGYLNVGYVSERLGLAWDDAAEVAEALMERRGDDAA